MTPATLADTAYAAGLFDGEGCITITRRRSGRDHNLAVRVTNTDRPIIDWLQKTFGGCTSGQRQPKGNRREAFLWAQYGAGAEEFLRAVIPYLRIKRVEAEIALRFAALKHGRRGQGVRLPPELVAAREACAVALVETRAAR